MASYPLHRAVSCRCGVSSLDPTSPVLLIHHKTIKFRAAYYLQNIPSLSLTYTRRILPGCQTQCKALLQQLHVREVVSSGGRLSSGELSEWQVHHG